MGVLYLASVGRRQGPVVLMRCDEGKSEERTMSVVFLSDALGPERDNYQIRVQWMSVHVAGTQQCQ